MFNLGNGAAYIPTQVQVLIVGGGNAALCAAIEARRAGAQVLLLEHANRAMRGGNSRHTRNMRIMHPEPLATLSESYSAEEYLADLLRVTGGKTNLELAELMIEQSLSLIDWLSEIGIRWQPSLSGTLSLSHSNAFFLGGGKALINAQYAYAEKIGIQIRYGCEVTGLMMEAGHCRGVELRQGDRDHQIAVGAVVVASGGFQANTEWMAEAWGAAARHFIVRGTPYAQGTVLRDLINKGASSIGDPSQGHCVAIDARAPKFDGGIVTRLDCVCFGIVVNKQAQRFYDEGEDFWPKRYAIWGRLVARQPDQIAYAIIDSTTINRFIPSVYPPVQADSIAELAVKMKLDSAQLEATLTEFNRSVQSGDFNSNQLDNCRTEGLAIPKSHWARKIETPPFYGYPLRPGVTFTYLGLKVNRLAKVMMEPDIESENLFAAGEIMAGNILGQGYCAGTGMTLGSVFGRIAGRGAAACGRQ